MQVTLKKFTIDERIDSDTFKAVAVVDLVEPDVKQMLGFHCRGHYNAVTNTFRPQILGDPYDMEPYYDQITEAVENR